MAVRVSDLIDPYRGPAASGDFPTWCERVELVAQLQKVDDLASFVPLFLRDEGFSVYQQLPAVVKGNFDTMKVKLSAAFGVSKTTAYEMLRERNLKEGESVDAYVADLTRLIKLVGVDPPPAPLLRSAFLAGLPEKHKEQLLMLPNIDGFAMDALLVKARALLGAGTSKGDAVGAAGFVKGQPRQGKGEGNVGGPRKCFGCGKTDHLQRDCPTRSCITCYSCGGKGHMARECPGQRQGNDVGEAQSALGASPHNHQ